MMDWIFAPLQVGHSVDWLQSSYFTSLVVADSLDHG
jgi:hypothetical protein